MGGGSLLAGAGGVLRQWRYPREFRVAAAPWPKDALAELAVRVTAELDQAPRERMEPAHPEPISLPEPAQAGLSRKQLAAVATGLWRMQGRLARMTEPPRPLVRNLEASLNALDAAEVVIRDHAGEPFDPGQVMSVVAYQPTPGLTREQVIETVLPGVYVGRHYIQIAEVIVGTPEAGEGSAPDKAEER